MLKKRKKQTVYRIEYINTRQKKIKNPLKRRTETMQKEKIKLNTLVQTWINTHQRGEQLHAECKSTIGIKDKDLLPATTTIDKSRHTHTHTRLSHLHADILLFLHIYTH